MLSIKNFVQLTDTLATAGQPAADDFQTIAEAGYRHVINLAMPDHPHALADEGKLVTETGMNYIHIPVPFDQPNPGQVRLFCQFMTSFNTDKVFVHCIMNFRVTAFAYVYLRQIEGRSEAESRSVMFDYWDVPLAWQHLLRLTRADLNLAPTPDTRST